jgi:hypothetical protein
MISRAGTPSSGNSTVGVVYPPLSPQVPRQGSLGEASDVGSYCLRGSLKVQGEPLRRPRLFISTADRILGEKGQVLSQLNIISPSAAWRELNHNAVGSFIGHGASFGHKTLPSRESSRSGNDGTNSQMQLSQTPFSGMTPRTTNERRRREFASRRSGPWRHMIGQDPSHLRQKKVSASDGYFERCRHQLWKVFYGVSRWRPDLRGQGGQGGSSRKS